MLNPDDRPDLLSSKYRPKNVNGFTCHIEQANRLKQWIRDFIKEGGCRSTAQDLEYSSSDSEHSNLGPLKPKCVLLTGPPGVGKTSLVYTIADELKLLVVESHPSEKRDFKLFSTLKLANQKGKINPIAKMFQYSQKEKRGSQRKRLKLIEPSSNGLPTNQISLSGDLSIVLFDDVEVFFEEDGPFLKSLIEFIRESKRPVVLTATQSVESIKTALTHCEHIHLDKPILKDCALLLRDICRNEDYTELTKISRCKRVAEFYNCDIRQSLNRIHFYGNQADQFTESFTFGDPIPPKFCKINTNTADWASNKSLLDCYSNRSLIDLIDSRHNFTDKSILLERWLKGTPSFMNEEHSFNHDLGKQVRDSIIELTKAIYHNELMTDIQAVQQVKSSQEMRENVLVIGNRISEKLITRIEPHEWEFFTDIVPLFGEIVKLEEKKKSYESVNGDQLRRRTRRTPSYLDDNKLYFDDRDIKMIGRMVANLGAES